MSNPTQNGYPAFHIPPQRHRLPGPDTAGVQFHDLLAVFPSGSGGIDSVLKHPAAGPGHQARGPPRDEAHRQAGEP